MTFLKTILLLSAGYVVYKHLTAEDEAPVIVVDYLPFNYNALTIPPFGVFVKAGFENNADLLSHERIHWQQYKEMGLVAYHATYLYQVLTYGYDAMPMEIAARMNEDDFCRLNYTQCVRNGTAKTVTNPYFRT